MNLNISNEALLLQANKDSIPDNDMVQHFNPDMVSSLDQLFCCSNVFLTRLWITGWMIMGKDD
jgi:hypothetical protein